MCIEKWRMREKKKNSHSVKVASRSLSGCLRMESFRGQIKLESHPDWCPLGIHFNFLMSISTLLTKTTPLSFPWLHIPLPRDNVSMWGGRKYDSPKMPVRKARSEDMGLLSVTEEDQLIQMKYLNSMLSMLKHWIRKMARPVYKNLLTCSSENILLLHYFLTLLPWWL